MRKKLIAGNWKMYKTDEEAGRLASGIADGFDGSDKADVLLCPPFTSIKTVVEVVEDSPIFVGGQNMGWEKEGAFTGEISPEMLLTLGCEYVILGHSERRQYFSESDQLIGKKCQLALSLGLKPIVCVGEQLEEREADKTEEIIRTQVEGFSAEVDYSRVEEIVIAYEPVWAIGTGKTATPDQAVEVHKLIRKIWKEKYDKQIADGLQILYGGSVKPENSDDLLGEEEIDGALIGGASLSKDKFLKIISSAT
ncbi:MAG TPA: triose-phosphate isomerase [candidate division Zixibacteria bacterium]|nr:triose-phosphate isomerase [candidate division Zixibacteria bacterium]